MWVIIPPIATLDLKKKMPKDSLKGSKDRPGSPDGDRPCWGLGWWSSWWVHWHSRVTAVVQRGACYPPRHPAEAQEGMPSQSRVLGIETHVPGRNQESFQKVGEGDVGKLKDSKPRMGQGGGGDCGGGTRLLRPGESKDKGAAQTCLSPGLRREERPQLKPQARKGAFGRS